MACSVTLSGRLVVGGDGCGCSGGSGGGATRQVPLAFSCSGRSYGAIVSSDCAQQVSTPGLPGDSWVDLLGTGQIKGYQLLYLNTRNPLQLRIGAEPATLVGVGASWPVVFGGGDTLALEVDGQAISITPTAGSATAQQVATLLNQAAVAAGMGYLPASVDSSGQLRITGRKTGIQGGVEITTPLADVGFPTAKAVTGQGQDLAVNGLQLLSFADDLPARIQISGQGQYEVLAAGTAAV